MHVCHTHSHSVVACNYGVAEGVAQHCKAQDICPNVMVMIQQHFYMIIFLVAVCVCLCSFPFFVLSSLALGKVATSFLLILLCSVYSYTPSGKNVVKSLKSARIFLMF